MGTQMYVRVPAGKTIDDVAADPSLALQLADAMLPCEEGTEWVLNDTTRLLELAQEG